MHLYIHAVSTVYLNFPLLNVIFMLLDSLDFFCEIIDSTYQFPVFFFYFLYCYWIHINLFWFKAGGNKSQHLVVYFISRVVWRFFSFLLLLGRLSSTIFLLRSVCTGQLWHFSTVSNVVLLEWQHMLDSEVEWNGSGAVLFFYLLIRWLCWSM